MRQTSPSTSERSQTGVRHNPTISLRDLLHSKQKSETQQRQLQTSRQTTDRVPPDLKASMEVLSRLFPYTKTVAGLKTTFTHVFRLKDPTADARRTARARIPSMRSHRELHPLRAHLRAPQTLEDMKRRVFTPITTKLAGLSIPLSQKRSYDFCSYDFSRLSKKHERNSEVYV